MIFFILNFRRCRYVFELEFQKMPVGMLVGTYQLLRYLWVFFLVRHFAAFFPLRDLGRYRTYLEGCDGKQKRDRLATHAQVPNADPLVCAFTLLASVPVLFFGFLFADKSLGVCLTLTFVAGKLCTCSKNR